MHVWACHTPSKLPLPLGGSASVAWFLGSTELSIPNGISIGSAVFAQLTAEWVAHSHPRNYPFPWGICTLN